MRGRPDLQTWRQFGAHLRELGPVKGLVAVEELSSQVTVLPVELLQMHNITLMDKHQLFGNPPPPFCLDKRASYVVLLKLLDGEFGLHQVVVEDDDLPAQRALLILVVLRLAAKGQR